MKIKHIVLSLIISCVVYALLFLFVLRQPLRIGIMQEYWEKKISHLESIEGSKVVILAGSNGRFSHRCETLEKEYEIPCANMSIAAGLSMDYQLEKIRPYLFPGDIVYLPLEYGALGGDDYDKMNGDELAYIVAYDHAQLIKMPPKKIIRSLFFFDVPFLISALGEMYLDRAGVSRRYSVKTMTPQGDESGHTLEKGASYREGLATVKWSPPGVESFNAQSYKAKVVKDFMGWATRNKVNVIGGLPTTFDDAPVPAELVENIGEFYIKSGHCFIALENRNQYPRDYFYDSPYHLSERYQIAHTRLLAPYFSRILGRDPSRFNQCVSD